MSGRSIGSTRFCISSKTHPISPSRTAVRCHVPVANPAAAWPVSWKLTGEARVGRLQAPTEHRTRSLSTLCWFDCRRMIQPPWIRNQPTYQQLPHVIAFLLLLARLGNVGSTYLLSPTLKLEANPIVRRLRWPFAGATILIAVLPYYSLPAGVAVLITSLLVCASNTTRLWLVRTMGESEYHLLLIGVARRAKRSRLGLCTQCRLARSSMGER
jgi:hypothetical protein